LNGGGSPVAEWVDGFKARTKRYALSVIQLVGDLPRSVTSDVIGRQLIRCSTSVPANYRAACRGRSKPEFCAKLGIVEEEADESIFWLEMIIEAGLLPPARVKPVLDEANEILAVIVSSLRTARSKADSSRR
jgi:four helix bundle protein